VLVVVLCKPKVGYLIEVVLDEDIGWLEVAMHYASVVQKLVAVGNLSHHLTHFFLGHLVLLLHQVFQRATVAQL